MTAWLNDSVTLAGPPRPDAAANSPRPPVRAALADCSSVSDKLALLPLAPCVAAAAAERLPRAAREAPADAKVAPACRVMKQVANSVQVMWLVLRPVKLPQACTMQRRSCTHSGTVTLLAHKAADCHGR